MSSSLSGRMGEADRPTVKSGQSGQIERQICASFSKIKESTRDNIYRMMLNSARGH